MMKLKSFCCEWKKDLDREVNAWIDKGEWSKIYWETLRLAAFSRMIVLIVMYDPKSEANF